MITGEIVELRPSFPSAGQPTLVINGLNLLHRLRKEQRSKAYVARTDTEIARQIASDLGITLAPQSPDVLAHRTAKRLPDPGQPVYDIIFLLDRARRIGYDLRVLRGRHGRDSAGPPAATSRRPPASSGPPTS